MAKRISFSKEGYSDDSVAMEGLVQRAVERRGALADDPETTAFRLVNGGGDALPGLTVDRYDNVLVVNSYDEPSARTARREAALIAALAALPKITAVYLKRRPRNAARLSAREVAALAAPLPAWGAAQETVVVREGGLRYLIRPGEGLSTGLFLDMRDGRARVRVLARGATVLNLFAYTCAFGVAAHVGGAARVLNLDAARPALRWGVENYVLNDLDADPYDFVYGDAFDWLERLTRRGTQFSLVIADPPSFSTVKGQRFSASRDYAALAAACARLSAPQGTLLLCTNEATLSRAAFRNACLSGVAATGRRATIRSDTGAPPLDFPPVPGSDGHLKVLELALD